MSHDSISLWHDTVKLASFPSLTRDAETDILIIGGGMAGALVAWELSERGSEFILVEGDRIGGGTSGGTTAVVSAQHSFLYSDMIKKLGEVTAAEYLEANLDALKRYERLSKKLDFDFESAPSCIYSLTERGKMEREVKALNRLGVSARFESETELPCEVAGAAVFPGQAKMHPLKLINAILSGRKNIYEHTKIDRVTGNNAYSGNIKISARKIIVATHFPIINTHGLYFAKLYQKRSYVIALEGAQGLASTYADDAESGLYFRSYKDLLIIGGGDHRTGKKGGNYAFARAFAERHYPNAHEKYHWATQDCMSLDEVPYIGQYSPNTPDILVASGFNEWGMTSSMAASRILADMALGEKSRFEGVFNPERSMIKPQLFANLGTTLADYVTPTRKRCPHLGCALKWNADEHSWDCPCHGSRFSESGELLNNPATGGLKK